MDGTIERHHKVDLLEELAAICSKENVKTPTKTIVDKHNAARECVTWGHYLKKFGGKESLIRSFHKHIKHNPPEEPTMPSLF